MIIWLVAEGRLSEGRTKMLRGKECRVQNNQGDAECKKLEFICCCDAFGCQAKREAIEQNTGAACDIMQNERSEVLHNVH